MANQETKPKRWRPWRFSLRTLLLAGPVIAITGAYGVPVCIRAFERTVDSRSYVPLPPAGNRFSAGTSVIFHVRLGRDGSLIITTSEGQPLPIDPSRFWPAVGRRIAEERSLREKQLILLMPSSGVKHGQIQKLKNGFEGFATGVPCVIYGYEDPW